MFVSFCRRRSMFFHYRILYFVADECYFFHLFVCGWFIGRSPLVTIESSHFRRNYTLSNRYRGIHRSFMLRFVIANVMYDCFSHWGFHVIASNSFVKWGALNIRRFIDSMQKYLLFVFVDFDLQSFWVWFGMHLLLMFVLRKYNLFHAQLGWVSCNCNNIWLDFPFETDSVAYGSANI